MGKTNTVITAGMIAALSLISVSPAHAVTQPAESEDRYIVTYSDSVSESKKNASIESKGAEVEKSFKHTMNGALVTATPKEADVLANAPGVLKVEEDVIMKASETTQSPAPWGLDRIDQREATLNQGYTYSGGGAGVKQYIVDTGVRTTHTEFSGRVASGYSAYSGGTEDCHGHGTHVASLAAGERYGVAKDSTIVPVRVLNCNGEAYTSTIIAGLEWIAVNHQEGEPAVTNLSLGGPSSFGMETAVESMIADGITVVAAAGNLGADACDSSPSRMPAAITVASTDRYDTQSIWSNHGSCIDVYAPGEAVIGAWYTSDTSGAYSSGTSMAAPAVSGAAALLLEKNPSLTPAQVHDAIIANATPDAVKNVTAGTHNRLLFTAPEITPVVVAKAPEASTNLRAYPKENAATFYWDKGVDNGSAITEQEVTVYSGETKVSSFKLSATASAVRINNLVAGKPYSFTVTSFNAVGASPESAKSKVVTPIAAGATAPSAVAAPRAYAKENAATVYWNKPVDNGSPITKQYITVYSGTTKVATYSAGATATAVKIGKLTAGKPYTFTVKSFNAVGVSPESAKSNVVTPTAPPIISSNATAPESPTNLRAYAKPSSALVYWDKGIDGGATLTKQVVNVYSGDTLVTSATASGTTTGVKISNLTPGTEYSFTVTAHNGVGASAESARSKVVIPTA